MLMICGLQEGKNTLDLRESQSPQYAGFNRNSFDKNFLFRGGSIGWQFLLVNGYFSFILHQKAGDGDAIWYGGWIGERPFEKSSHLLVESPGKRAFIHPRCIRDRRRSYQRVFAVGGRHRRMGSRCRHALGTRLRHVPLGRELLAAVLPLPAIVPDD
jgi:hypothetical protein